MRKPGIVLLLLFTAGAAFAQPREGQNGIITGRVTNEAGESVVGAKVHAERVEVNRPAAGARWYAETDEDGNFTLDHLAWGLYAVFAEKEEDGYPDTYISVYFNGILAECEVGPMTSPATVLVTIGPKAGVVSGSISNAVTGAAIQNAGIRIFLWGDSAKYLDTSTLPAYRMLVPADTPVGLEVHAPGFETWYYAKDAAQTERIPLTLKSDGRMKLDIKLRPSPK